MLIDMTLDHVLLERAYEMCVETGDIESAGSDCRVTVQLFGQGGASSTPITLHKREDTLERANKDIHQVNRVLASGTIFFEALHPSTPLVVFFTGWFAIRRAIRYHSGHLMIFCSLNFRLFSNYWLSFWY